MTVGITINHLAKEFLSPEGTIQPVKDFSLDVPCGKLSSVIGKSGCGKTTLLKLISGLEHANNGEIKFVNEKGETVKNPKISFVFQEPRLLPWKTVGQNLALAIRQFSREEQEGRIKEALELVRLGQIQDFYPSELSGGMAQRVGLARGVISQPDILLLDEPFCSLDYMTRTKLLIDFSKLQSELSMTMLMITHDINEAVFLSTKVAYLNEGVLEQEVEIDLEIPRKIDDPRLLPYQRRLLNIILE